MVAHQGVHQSEIRLRVMVSVDAGVLVAPGVPIMVRAMHRKVVFQATDLKAPRAKGGKGVGARQRHASV